MHQHELSPQEQKAHLAGAIRNHLASTHVFSPWEGFDLQYHDGHLCKVTPPNAMSHHRQYAQLFAQDKVYEMDDDAIWAAVTGEKPAKKDVRHHAKS